MRIAKMTRAIDSKGRVCVPKEALEQAGLAGGGRVWFAITKAGNLLMVPIGKEGEDGSKKNVQPHCR